jgi:hypothetical protein
MLICPPYVAGEIKNLLEFQYADRDAESRRISRIGIWGKDNKKKEAV